MFPTSYFDRTPNLLRVSLDLVNQGDDDIESFTAMLQDPHTSCHCKEVMANLTPLRVTYSGLHLIYSMKYSDLKYFLHAFLFDLKIVYSFQCTV